MQSLLSARMVCRSWNAAASDNFLWQVHYSTYFSVSIDKFHVSSMSVKDPEHSASTNGADATLCHSKESFRKKFLVSPWRRLKHDRGYRGSCNSIVWLTNLKCHNRHIESRSGNHLIKPIQSLFQIVDFILHGSPPTIDFDLLIVILISHL